MSYELFLKSEYSPLAPEQFVSYFAQRLHYTINGGSAFYENEDTGVHFCFDYGAEAPDAITFTLNYLRPHFFGYEAAAEVEALINTFSLSIEDPQQESMGNGPFSVEGFLRGWNAGNYYSYSVILTSDERPELHVYPTNGLERVWRWNFQRLLRQEQVGDVLFFPKVAFMKGQDMAQTAIIWPDACPIYMPKADLVLIFRKQLSSNPNAADPQEFTLLKWSDVEPVVSAYPYDEEGECYRLDYEVPPSTVSEFVRSVPLMPYDRDAGLAYGNVLNLEWVQEFAQIGDAS